MASSAIANKSLEWTLHYITTKQHLEKRSGEGNVDSGLQGQLEEDRDGSIRQS